jgi:hypothetical protein
LDQRDQLLLDKQFCWLRPTSPNLGCVALAMMTVLVGGGHAEGVGFCAIYVWDGKWPLVPRATPIVCHAATGRTQSAV